MLPQKRLTESLSIGLSPKSLLISAGISLVLVVLFSVLVLALFRIETWGGDYSSVEQATIQSVGPWLLAPISLWYVISGLVALKALSWRWVIAFGIGALGLGLWNNWHTPSIAPSPFVRAIFEMSPFMPTFHFMFFFFAIRQMKHGSDEDPSVESPV